MTNDKVEQTLPIAELLPEGLSEAAISEIGTLVNNVISEQVETKVRQLEAKVTGFIRSRVDELKDQAVRELHEEDETIRNASLFESVKTLMALEMNKDDDDNAISDLVHEQKEFEAEVEVLTEELRKSFEETEKLNTSVNALSTKVDKLKEDKATLLEAVEILEESKDKPFKSSEKAVIIAEDVDKREASKPVPQELNDLLTPEVMKFMPQSNTESYLK
jgi:citrate synthase|tara:strand:+ start:4897 stop:5553 length:657 start_codon:yes stop_codon:yes gene_type:complete